MSETKQCTIWLNEDDVIFGREVDYGDFDREKLLKIINDLTYHGEFGLLQDPDSFYSAPDHNLVAGEEVEILINDDGTYKVVKWLER